MLQSSTNRKTRTTAKTCLRHLREGKKKSPLNLSHQLYMLEAEYAVFKRNYTAAEKFYSLAIGHAAGVIHEHALACERFGCLYVLRQDHNKAYEQIREAYRLYSKWGEPFCVFLFLLRYSFVCPSIVKSYRYLFNYSKDHALSVIYSRRNIHT